jgi:PAS domain S-box-containing protein
MTNINILMPEGRRSKKVFPDIVRDNDEFLRTVLETTPDCIKVVAPDGRLLQMNSAGLKMIDARSFEEVDHVSAYDVVAPEHRSTWRKYHQRVCQGESLVWEFEIIGLKGTRRFMNTHAAPIGLADGTVGQLAVSRDITARKDAERALRHANEALEEKVSERTHELEATLNRLQDSERNFGLLVESVTDYAIFMLDPDGRVVSWNAGAARIKGYASEEIIGKHFSCFYTEDDQALKFPMRGLRTALREGRMETEGWRVRKDGSRFWANVIIDAIRVDGELIGFAKITRDITERRAAEARLRQAQKMEAVGQFTGGAAHDFNNLLMAVLGSLELLRKYLPDDQRIRGLLDNAVQGAKRGASLTQRMLAFARRQELKREAVDLSGLVNGIGELVERSLGPSVNVEVHIPRHLPRVATDVTQLETALLNLAINSRDAMLGGGTFTISAREEPVEDAHITGLGPGLFVCLSVTDTGHGMDEKTLARATEPFFTTKGIGKGTGLGLSMIDGLMAQSGGRLTVRSQLGQGTTVELWFPVVSETHPAAEQILSSNTTTDVSAAGRPLVILAVDDDSLVLMNVVAMLEDLGHKVIDAASAPKALQVIDADPSVDLVVTDQAMPGMSGVQLIAAIKERRPTLPVILATGYAELPSGIDRTIGRLAKPFTQLQLANAVAAMDRRVQRHGA